MTRPVLAIEGERVVSFEVKEPQFPPLASRDELLVSAWLNRELPPRDYLLGQLLCTTSRVLLIGETGVGKTLFSLELGRGASGWR